MSGAERRHGTTSARAPSGVRRRESALPAGSAASAASASTTPVASPEGVRVLLFGEPSALLLALASELERTGIAAEFMSAPDDRVVENTARTLAFVDLGTPNDRDTARILTWRERLPHAIWLALADGLQGHTVARLLAAGVTSIPKPIAPFLLAELAHSLAQRTPPCPSSSVHPGFRADDLTPALHAYSGFRALSGQQRLILGLYLAGSNDKSIAERCGCSEATVYEHWRRMAKKAGGTHKADAINDFHRFLAGT
jgi:DNA-binding NarL/FixJ family response regulator